MGDGAYINHGDGTQENLPAVDEATAIEAYRSISWPLERDRFQARPEDDHAPDGRPEFCLVDDAGHTLRITPYSEEWTEVEYHYPTLDPMCPDRPGEDDGCVLSRRFPSRENEALIRVYFARDPRAIFQFLEPFTH